MEPLIALVGVTLVLSAAGIAGVRRLRPFVVPLRIGLAVMFTMTGLAHFVGLRGELVAMVPPSLPAPGLLVTVTGVMELVGAAALLRARTAPFAAAGLTGLLLAVFPANVHAAQDGLNSAGEDRLGYRAAMQVLFLAATITVAIRGRRQRQAKTSAAPSDSSAPGVVLAVAPTAADAGEPLVPAAGRPDVAAVAAGVGAAAH